MIQRTTCPITGQPASIIFSRPYSRAEFQPLIARGKLAELVADKHYEIRHCAASGLHFQTWVMEDGELAGWYSPPTGDEFFQSEIAKQRLHWFAHMTEEILVFRQLCPEKWPAVLDFGCNWGKWGSVALAHGCDVFAVEVNRSAAEYCARRGIKIIAFDQLDELRFDFINVDQVMEHLSEPLSVAQKLAACLKPGGFLKMSTPDNPRLPRILAAAQRTGDNGVLNAKTLDSLAPLEHVNLFTRAALESLGQKAGLRVYRLPLIKWLGAGQLWNVPRQLNRNLVTPFKRWLGRGTYVWFQKPPQGKSTPKRLGLLSIAAVGLGTFASFLPQLALWAIYLTPLCG
ncbi:MAG: class I SAM-dependent methyltransferase [Verrucomicrobia bacterium]|nr:class I SAM-dependent methyltransferase [Verrucomicrobiota bacterium]